MFRFTSFKSSLKHCQMCKTNGTFTSGTRCNSIALCVCYVLYCLLLLVFVDHFHPTCLSPEAPCQQGLSGRPGVTWWWPRHHLALTSCHQVLFSLFEFSQQSLYTEVPRIVIPGIFLRSDISPPPRTPLPPVILYVRLYIDHRSL